MKLLKLNENNNKSKSSFVPVSSNAKIVYLKILGRYEEKIIAPEIADRIQKIKTMPAAISLRALTFRE